MKKVWIVLGFLILAVVVLVDPAMQWREYQLGKAMEKLETDVVTLNEVVPFAWEKVYTFSPYTGREEIEEIIGFRDRGIEETVSEGMVQLIFVQGNEVTASVYGYPSALGYQVEFTDAVTFAEEASFSVERKNGIVCLTEQKKGFATAEAGVAYYLEEGEEVLWQDSFLATEIAILYSARDSYFRVLGFAEEKQGYVEQWGLARYGSGVSLTVDAPWEAEEAAASPRYEILLLLEDASLEGSLTASEFQEAIERDGKRLGAKITRYAMQPMLTKELRLQET